MTGRHVPVRDGRAIVGRGVWGGLEPLSGQDDNAEATLAPPKGGSGSMPSVVAVRRIRKSYPFPLAFGFRLLTAITTPLYLPGTILVVVAAITYFLHSMTMPAFGRALREASGMIWILTTTLISMTPKRSLITAVRAAKAAKIKGENTDA